MRRIPVADAGPVTPASPGGGGQSASLEPFVDAARQALRKVLSGVALPAGISLDDLAYPAVLAVLSEVYQHPGLFPGAAAAAGRGLRPSGADAADATRNLVNRTQMAARLDVNISTVMSWIERYEDFPGWRGQIHPFPSGGGQTSRRTAKPTTSPGTGISRLPGTRNNATRRSSRSSPCSPKG